MTSARCRKAFTMIEMLVVIAVIGLLVVLLIPAVQSARAAARLAQCRGNLRQLGIALNAYQAAAGVFPFGVGADGDGAIATYTSRSNRRYSMHSQVLPYLERTGAVQRAQLRRTAVLPRRQRRPGPRRCSGDELHGRAGLGQRVRLPVGLQPDAVLALGQVNYRSCTGSTWSARVSDGMFGQSTRIAPANVRDGLSNTAAMSERLRGHDDFENVDVTSDQFRVAAPWTEAAFTEWCATLSDAEAIALPKHYSNATAGLTWLEGNMSWTRYNHLLPPGRKTCVNGVTWNGVAMTAGSRHDTIVGLLLGDGSVRFVKDSVGPAVWRALGTIAGGETVPGDAF